MATPNVNVSAANIAIPEASAHVATSSSRQLFSSIVSTAVGTHGTARYRDARVWK